MRKPIASVMLDLDLFYDILDFLKLHEDADSPQYVSIQERIMEKLGRMAQHKYYTDFKTAKTDDAKAGAFNKYLDEIGMPEELRLGFVRAYLERLKSGHANDVPAI